MSHSRALVFALWIVSACSSEGAGPADARVPVEDASTPQEIDARTSDGTVPPMDALLADVNTPDAADATLADTAVEDATPQEAEEDASADASIGTLIQTREGGGFGSLQVVGNAAGDVVAIWQQNDVSQVDRIWSAHYRPLGGWSIPTEVEQHSTGAYIIDLAIDAAGNAMAVWHEQEVPFDRSWASRFDASSGWGAPTRIENLGVDTRASSVTLFADGSALVVGDAGPGTNRYGWSNHFTTSGGWELATAFASGNPALAPELSADAAGDAMAVWCSWDGGSTLPKLMARHWRAQGGWETPVNVPIGSGGCVIPQLATVASAHYLALYHLWDGSYPALWAAPYRNGAWQSPTLIEDNDKRASAIALPQVAVASGKASVLYAGNNGIWHKEYTGSWSAAALVSSGTGNGYTLTAYPANTVGDSLAVWYRGGDAKSPLFARYRATNEFVDFSLPVTQTSGVYKAVLDTALTSLWTTLDGSTSKLWATRTQLPR